MRIQSTHSFGARGLDAYFTCREAIDSLILLEGDHMPRRIWEPAAGTGNIVIPLRRNGRTVIASDIFNYGLQGCEVVDYLSAPAPDVEGIVTNPPFRLAQKFAEKALDEVNYLALLVRTNFLMDGVARGH